MNMGGRGEFQLTLGLSQVYLLTGEVVTVCWQVEVGA
jgi:hypothetical protein